MECSYDYITHLTIYTIEDRPGSEGLTISYKHSVSPLGREEMYLFKDAEEAKLTGIVSWRHVHGKLFQDEDFPSTMLVDFETATLIEVQFLEHRMLNNSPAEYLNWDCRRLD